MATKKRPMKIRKPPPVEPIDVEAFVASGAPPNPDGAEEGADQSTRPAEDQSADNSAATDYHDAPSRMIGDKVTSKEDSTGRRRTKPKRLPRGCQLRKDGTVVKRRTVYLDPTLDHALTVFSAIGQEDVSETIARAVRALIKRENPDVLAADGPMSVMGT